MGDRSFNLTRFLRNAAIIAAVVALGVGGWKAYEARYVPKNLGVVEEGRIYRSGKLTPHTLETIAERHDIRTVIDFGAYKPNTPEHVRIVETARRLGLDRFELRMRGDGTGDPNHYVAALKILEDPSRHPVLVHCAAGAQRTGMCVVLYRNLIQGDDLHHAYEESFDFGHDPGDNWRFLTYLAEWRHEITRAFADGRPIDWTDPRAAKRAATDGAQGARAAEAAPEDAAP